MADIERATQIARSMVTRWGPSEKLGPLAYAEEEGEVFLGQAVTSRKNMSDDTARLVDNEIRALIDQNYERARQILQQNIDVLHRMAKALVEWEILYSEQISASMEGRELDANRPDDWTRPDRGSDLNNGPSSQVKPRKPAAGPMQPQQAG